MEEHHIWIAELQPGTFTGVYRIRSANIRTDRRGGYYLDLTLFDQSGALPAKFWKAHPNMLDSIGVGDFLRVVGRVEVASDQLQIVMDEFLLAEEHEVDHSLYQRVSELDPAETLSDCYAILQSIESRYYRDLVDAFVFDDDFVDLLLITPGSYRRHHAWAGGLVEHLHSILTLALRVLDHYPRLDRDLLLMGAFLHDLGKVLEFDWNGEPGTTVAGRMLGHIPLGLELLNTKVSEVKGFPEEKLMMLKHMVYSHHESARYGSPKAPLFPEALVLQSLEALDSRLSTMFETLANPPEQEYPEGTIHRGNTGARWAFKASDNIEEADD